MDREYFEVGSPVFWGMIHRSESINPHSCIACCEKTLINKIYFVFGRLGSQKSINKSFLKK